MFTHIRLAIWAFLVLWNFKSITPRNRFRLWKKSGALYLAFLAFTDEKRPKGQLERALKSAIMSAMYDYETDWARVDDPYQSLSFTLLEEWVESDELSREAKDLFWLDWGGSLSTHGLERGGAALKFYAGYIGAQWLSQYTVYNLISFGNKLQIVDDCMDLPYDSAAKHKNCFLTNQRGQFMRELSDFLESVFFQELSRRSWVYRYLYRKCQENLQKMKGGWCP